MLRTPRRYWTCQLAGWTLYAVVNIALGAAFGGLSLGGVGSGLAIGAVGLAASHALRTVARRRGWMAMPVGAIAARMAIGSVAAAVAMTAVVVAVAIAVGPPPGAENVPALGPAVALVMGFNWTALLLLWSLLYAGVHLVERWREAERRRAHAEAERWRSEAAAREAELRALQAQVNPHFLFNSLNTVRALIPEAPDRARDAVTELADLLRYALAAGRHETVALADELATVRRYLALEALRFEDRLQVAIDADPAALGAAVPPLVLQTLVENGIKHGIGRSPEGGTLRLDARAEDGAVRVRIESPGRLDADAQPESGVGLANASERLRRLCGDRAALVVRQATPATVVAELVLPTAAVDGDPQLAPSRPLVPARRGPGGGAVPSAGAER